MEQKKKYTFIDLFVGCEKFNVQTDVVINGTVIMKHVMIFKDENN